MIRIFIFALASTLLVSCCSANETSDKQLKYEAMTQEINTWVDGVGYPIEEKIKETVIVLNLLDFTTLQSCEGHDNWGTLYPWVNFEIKSPEIQLFDDQIEVAGPKIVNEEKNLQERFPQLSITEIVHLPEAEAYRAMYRDYNNLCNEMNKLQKARLKPLYTLLQEFYKNRSTPFDQTIILTENTIRSIGGIFQDIRSEEEMKQNLSIYQNEMKDFTEFLKNHYFSQ